MALGDLITAGSRDRIRGGRSRSSRHTTLYRSLSPKHSDVIQSGRMTVQRERIGSGRRSRRGLADAAPRRRTIGRPRLGTFYTAYRITNHIDRARSARLPKVWVDTGSEHTWAPQATLRRIGITPENKVVKFKMANGLIITRQIGFAIIEVDGRVTTDEVVFGQVGDMQLLGARTLERLHLRVDSRMKKLVSGGPLPAA